MPDSTIFVTLAIAYLLWVGSMFIGSAAPGGDPRPVTTAAQPSMVGGLGDAAGQPGSTGGHP